MVAQSVFSTGLISSYCAADEVWALLVGYDLARLGEETARDQRLATLLPLTRRAVETAAGRDFFWHPGEVVTRDGSGQERLSLVTAGTTPLTRVTAVAIAGEVLPETAYVVYPERAEIRLVAQAGAPERFPVGQLNVAVTVDWGYEQVPGDVSLAQAKLTAAQLLAEAAGETASAERVALGDWAVTYAPAGKYGAVIGTLVREAQELLRPYRRVRMRAV